MALSLLWAVGGTGGPGIRSVTLARGQAARVRPRFGGNTNLCRPAWWPPRRAGWEESDGMLKVQRQLRRANRRWDVVQKRVSAQPILVWLRDSGCCHWVHAAFGKLNVNSWLAGGLSSPPVNFPGPNTSRPGYLLKAPSNLRHHFYLLEQPMPFHLGFHSNLRVYPNLYLQLRQLPNALANKYIRV